MEGIIIDHIRNLGIWKEAALISDYIPFTIQKGEYEVLNIFHEISSILSIDFDHNFIIKTIYRYEIGTQGFYMSRDGEPVKSFYLLPDHLTLYSSETNYTLEQKHCDGHYVYYSHFKTNKLALYKTGELRSIEIYKSIPFKPSEPPEPIDIYIFDKDGINTYHGYRMLGKKLIENIVNYDNGVIKQRSQSATNKKDQLIEKYSPEGRLISKYCDITEETDRSKRTYYFTYHPNGRVKTFVSYVDDEKTGFDVSFYPTGRVKKLYTYKYNVFSGPFFEMDEYNNVIIEGYYTDGLLDGFYREYVDGKLKYQGMCEIESGESVKKGTWLERKGNILEEFHYQATTGVAYFPPSPLV